MSEAERLALLAFTKALTLEGGRVAMRFLGEGPCAWKGAERKAGTEWPEYGEPREPTGKD